MPQKRRQHESPSNLSHAIGEEIVSMTKISPDMTIREIALLPEFSGFGEHIMLCRQETWARIQKTKVSAMIEKSGSQYQLGRFIRGLQSIVDLADAGHKITFDFWTPLHHGSLEAADEALLLSRKAGSAIRAGALRRRISERLQ
jgi:hypothetical protein